MFPCEVGVAHFTPPELAGRNLHELQRTTNHDCFGLAVLIFHLLFLGRHPYAGRFLGIEDMPIERAIHEHRFAFGHKAAECKCRGRRIRLPLDEVAPVAGGAVRAGV